MLALNSCDFRLASFLRLGLPIAFSSWTTTCNCGALIDDSGYHLLTCKTGGGPVWSHELILSIWSDCFCGLHIHHRREPRSRYTTTDNRPDIVGRPNAAEFIDFWSKRFSIQLQKCNARVISKKLSTMSEDNRCDLFATQYFSH